MKTPPRKAGTKQPSREELKGLERALTKAYARLRARALADWARHHAGKKDPADARVSVRISATTETGTASTTKHQTARPLVLPKPRLAQKKSLSTKGCATQIGRPLPDH